MSNNRLWPLGSSILRNTAGNASPILPNSELYLRLRPPPRAGFRTLPSKRRPEVSQRYGTANEPLTQIGGGRIAPPNEAPTQRALPKPDKPKREATAKQREIKATVEPQTVADAKAASTAKLKQTVDEKAPAEAEAIIETEDAPDSPKALSEILKMEPPMSENNEEKPPHLQAPPYVHHFDTYTLVRTLESEGSFSEMQAVTVMKAVRGLLADNMDLARDGIVGKGDGEMAAYLFRAACSELRTEMRNNRAALTERMRTERTALQHEVDILAQRITADTSNLKDELKGMFDDRKMSVRMERRDIENKIQELNYHITSRLNSELRSEVEGLRWVLVRRTAIAIVMVALTALITLRLNSTAQKRAESGEASRRSGEKGTSGGFAPPSTHQTQAGSEELMKVLEGSDPSLVSLG